MNIYRLSQTINDGYDTYDSCIVIAASEDDARRMRPGHPDRNLSEWAAPEHVLVELLGTANEPFSGVVCASYRVW